MRVEEGRGAGDAITGYSGMSTSTKYDRAELSTQNFHPEFGYFCPSARMQRKLRSAAITVVLAGLMLAAGAAVGLQFAPADDDVRQEAPPILVSRPLDQATVADAARIADDGVPAMMAQAVPVVGEGARSQTSCDDLSGSFLASRCQVGKTGKHLARTARAARSRMAEISIGRAEAGLDDGPQGSEASRSSPAGEAAAAFATTEAPPGPPAKKPVKIVHKRPPNPEIATSAPLAAPPTPGFDLFGLFREAPRSGNSVWAMSR
jgi:hypothetical protein